MILFGFRIYEVNFWFLGYCSEMFGLELMFWVVVLKCCVLSRVGAWG